MIQKQVLWFQVSVDYVELMEVLDTCNDLVEEFERLRLLDPLILDNVVEELAPVGILHDQVQLLRRLNNLVKLNDVRVSDLLKDVYLTGDSLNIGLPCDLALFKNFDGDLRADQTLSLIR